MQVDRFVLVNSLIRMLLVVVPLLLSIPMAVIMLVLDDVPGLVPKNTEAAKNERCGSCGYR